MLSAVFFFSFSRNIQRSLYRAQCASLKHFYVFVPFGICSKWKHNQRLMKQEPLRNNVVLFFYSLLDLNYSCTFPLNHMGYISIFRLPKLESICRTYCFSNKVYLCCLSVFNLQLLIISLVYLNFSSNILFLPNDHQAEKDEKK